MGEKEVKINFPFCAMASPRHTHTERHFLSSQNDHKIIFRKKSNLYLLHSIQNVVRVKLLEQTLQLRIGGFDPLQQI